MEFPEDLKYSKEHEAEVIQAKDKYFENTGRPNEEDPDYESRLNNFNDWFIFNQS